MTVYFDNAILNPDGAKINIDASFAGVELFIPKEWEVIMCASSTLGGIEESRKDKNKPDGKNKLTITGNASFAGIEITYV